MGELSDVHSLMIRTALVASLGLVASAVAQELDGSASELVRPTSFASLPTIYSAPESIALSDQVTFYFPRSFAWISATPVDFLPGFALAPMPIYGGVAPASEGGESPDGKGNFIPKVDYAGGEVGFLFGKSLDGQIKREVESGYILGEIISGKTHIEVGASYTRDQISR
jgi:hypothetical protein